MLTFKNILIPTDFSKASWESVQLGLSLASKDSEITLLHVYPAVKHQDALCEEIKADQHWMDKLEAEMRQYCDSLQTQSRSAIKHVVLKGSVESQVVGFIKNNHFDLVIMGVNSNGTDNHPGSHLNSIIEATNTPVLIVPNVIEKQVA